MMIEEMDMALIEVVIGRPREALTGGDLQAPIGERGQVLIMAADVDAAVAQVLIKESGPVLIMAVAQAPVSTEGRGILIMVVVRARVLTEGRGIPILATVLAQVPKEGREIPNLAAGPAPILEEGGLVLIMAWCPVQERDLVLMITVTGPALAPVLEERGLVRMIMVEELVQIPSPKN